MKSLLSIASLARKSDVAAAAATLLIGSAAGGQVLQPIQTIQPADGADGNFFGSDIELADGKLYVAAAGRINGGTAGSGAVYVYDADTLTLLNTITASNAAPLPEPLLFGKSIAVQVDRLLVGSDDVFPNDPQRQGAAYLMSASTGAQLARYTDTLLDPGTPSRDFGDAVALAGDTAIVGDRGSARTPTGQRDGIVSFFDIPSGQQEIRLPPANGVYSNRFGQAIETRGNEVYIAGQFADGLNAYDANTRQIIDTLSPPSNPIYFGFGLAIHGDMLAAADSAWFVPEGEFFPTAVYLFDLNSKQLVRTFTVNPDPGDIGLGRAVAVNDTYLIASRNLSASEFSLFVFDVATGELLDEITAPGGFARSFGSAVTLNGDLAYVNVRENEGLPLPGGAVLVYDLSQIVLCPADVNGDGLLTPADFNAWVAAFNSGAPECDQNADGLCTPADFNAWIANFNAGC